MNLATPLRERLRQKLPLAGIFYKSACHQGIEVVEDCGLDYLVIDAEHAPFSANQLDVCLLAARATGLPTLVRVTDDQPATLLAVMDMGATGVMVPHVNTAEKARAAVAGMRYVGGTRGFSNSPRAGAYGRVVMQAHLRDSDRGAIVFCQIEEHEAIEAIEDIAAVDGVDCLFIGRADLTVSMGCDDIADPRIDAAIEKVTLAGRRADVAVGIFLSDLREVPRYMDLGITVFVIGSDQSALASAVRNVARGFHDAARSNRAATGAPLHMPR
jgi:2-keto-3-deoxy-L-rhamnonate aldolase RhmA